jgi:hypothetical protein
MSTNRSNSNDDDDIILIINNTNYLEPEISFLEDEVKNLHAIQPTFTKLLHKIET